MPPSQRPLPKILRASSVVAILVATGLTGGIAQLLVTQSYVYADTSTVAPFEYTSILFGIALGFTLFGELPTSTMLAGSAVVIAAGLLILWREQAIRSPKAQR